MNEIKVLRTIWTSFGKERLTRVTLPSGEVKTAWYREYNYHRLTTYGEALEVAYTQEQIREAMSH